MELVRDVAFGAPPISTDKAKDMLARTRAYALLKGYRGDGPYDLDAVISARIALGDIAQKLGDVIETVDINPFKVQMQGGGGMALDALVVVRADTRKAKAGKTKTGREA